MGAVGADLLCAHHPKGHGGRRTTAVDIGHEKQAITLFWPCAVAAAAALRPLHADWAAGPEWPSLEAASRCSPTGRQAKSLARSRRHYTVHSCPLTPRPASRTFYHTPIDACICIRPMLLVPSTPDRRSQRRSPPSATTRPSTPCCSSSQTVRAFLLFAAVITTSLGSTLGSFP